jgi:hypothetical protein
MAIANDMIGWHTSEGFAMQFVERMDEIATITNQEALSNNCNAWTSHSEEFSIEQDDSGV